LKLKPVTLYGNIIRLEPLSLSHVPGLTIAGNDLTIWRYLPYGEITNEEKMIDFVKMFLKKAEEGTDLPFSVIHTETNQPIGFCALS
jgi:hypothetical protein